MADFLGEPVRSAASVGVPVPNSKLLAITTRPLSRIAAASAASGSASRDHPVQLGPDGGVEAAAADALP